MQLVKSIRFRDFGRSRLRLFAQGMAAIAMGLFAFTQVAKAADRDLDPSFGTGGIVTTDFNRSTDIAYAVAQQADGKLVVVGTTYTNNDYSGEDFALARYNPRRHARQHLWGREEKRTPIFRAWPRLSPPWSFSLTAKSWSRASLSALRLSRRFRAGSL
jgi:hypothetical protein